MESILEISSAGAGELVDAVKDSLLLALAGKSEIDPAILSMMGASGKKYRHFINNLIRRVPGATYLEIGVWVGSTFCSAINGNRVKATAIDNWSEFFGTKEKFLHNLDKFRTQGAEIDLIESDFKDVNFARLGKYTVYLFDGPHEEKDQFDALALAIPCLSPQFIFIVDDWNWVRVRSGTFDAIRKLGLNIDYAVEIRSSLDETHPDPEWAFERSDWHNGYFISVISQPIDIA